MKTRDEVVRELEALARPGPGAGLTLRCVLRRAFDAGLAEGRAVERRDVVAFIDDFDCPNCHPGGNHYPCSGDNHALAEYDAIKAGAHVPGDTKEGE